MTKQNLKSGETGHCNFRWGYRFQSDESHYAERRCTEQWICDNPEAITGLQRKPIKRRVSDCLCPTFSANAISLQNHGLEKHVRDLNLHVWWTFPDRL